MPQRQRRDLKVNAIDRLIGERMRAQRKAAKITEAELGEFLGLTGEQIQGLENGADRVNPSTLFRVARALDVPLSCFFVDMPDHAAVPAPAAPDVLTTFEQMMQDETGALLVEAFLRIEDPAIRRRLVEIAAAMAGTGWEEGKPRSADQTSH